MMDWMRQWILGVTCAAVLCALLQAFLPKGGLEKAGRLVGALVLLIATVQPLAGLDYASLAETLAQYRLAQSDAAAEAAEMSGEVLKTIIEQQAAAYILDKAEELGFQCEADVVCADGESGVPYPASVRIVSSADEEQQRRLAQIIEADLGIPADSQSYERAVE